MGSISQDGRGTGSDGQQPQAPRDGLPTCRDEENGQEESKRGECDEGRWGRDRDPEEAAQNAAAGRMMGAVGRGRRDVMLVMLVDLHRRRMGPIASAGARRSAGTDEQSLQDKREDCRERDRAADLSPTCGWAPHAVIITGHPPKSYGPRSDGA